MEKYRLRRLILSGLITPILAAAQQAPDTIPIIPLGPPPPAVTSQGSPLLGNSTESPVVVPPRVYPHLSAEQATSLRGMLDRAAADGIAPSGETSAAPEGEGDTALIKAALDYAQALHHGRLSSGDFLNNWGLRPAAYDPWLSFVAAVHDDRLGEWIASLPPPYAGYDTLKKALATYRGIASAGGWPVVAGGPDLVPGGVGEHVATLRRRLAIEDRAVSKGAARYDDDLVAAVQRAQRRYGLDPTGLMSKATLTALNVSAADRVRQIEANMERWRWLPADLPAHRFQVNIAAAVLTVFDSDHPVMSMRAVTGRPGDETPMLSSQIHSIVFNPPWNVPSSIASRELWPKERGHPGYLKAHGFRVIDTGDGGKRLQQKSGSKSALGRVKFDFDNPYGVYLHDTPSQGTFGRYSRLASHGCVRLAHPVELAKLALESTPDWAPDAVDAALAKGDTVRARLAEPIAVFLLYWTAYASADGKVSFLDDPYGWDNELANRLKTSANRARLMVSVR